MTNLKSNSRYYTHTKHPSHSSNPNPNPNPNPNRNRNRNRNSRRNRKNSSSSSSSGSNQTRCWTWLLTPGNSHFAKNRSSFTTYRRAPSKVGGRRVLGVGTVELKVRRSPEDGRMNILVLEDVLHMPNAACNGLCVRKYCQGNAVETGGVWIRDRDRDRGAKDGGGEGEEEYFQVWESEGEEEEGGCGGGCGYPDGRGHGEALWYGEGYRGCSKLKLWGDPRGQQEEELLRNGDGDFEPERVNAPGVEAPEEELNTLYTRVKERSLT
ncbi:hypothetical protein BJX61DRAFT_92921 [Aspergillus egyptiacus]|nr:hypothetical protein BJX61DRAFT_92921 [Aspergillus egyptiacus]